MVSRFPSRSRHAIGSTMNEAPVSTKASHLTPLDRSEALSILTEATILPIVLSLIETIHQRIKPNERESLTTEKFGVTSRCCAFGRNVSSCIFGSND